MKTRLGYPLAAAVLAAVSWHGVASAQALVDETTIESTVMLAEQELRGSEVSAVVHNTGQKRLAEVKLLVKYAWVWTDKNDAGPAGAEFVTLAGDLEPGSSMPFTHRSRQPLPYGENGYIVADIEIVGFTAYEQ